MVVTALNLAGSAQTTVTTPKAYFGFEPGADGTYASWDRLVAYYEQIDKESDRVQTRVIGKSTLGNPFLVVTISSPQNLAKVPRFQEIARQLSDPRGLTEQQTDALAREGRAVVLVSLGQHSTEVASTQTGAKLVYRLATSDDERTRAILDNVILVLIPAFNPDGQMMVADWVKKTAGTPYEGSGTPDIYHHYVGHDNNRDAYMLTQIESKLWAKVAYREWYPQIYKDTHQMGSYGARLYIPPKTDPIDPNVDPLVWRESMLLGGAMGTMLEAEGITGVESQVGSFTAWQIPTFHGMANHRNIPAFHTESASARMIWPLYIHPQELQPSDRGRPEYKAQMSFPHPWPGGWWRMGDIVRQQEAAIFALVETAGRHREMFLRNMAIKARRQVQRGATEAPYAHVVPMRQHDPGTAAKLIATLMEANVEVHRLAEGFRAGLSAFEAGDFVIRHDQPARPYIKTLLEPLIYPDNPWTRNADGTPLRPKDLASSNLGELMGVDVVPANEKIGAKLEKLTEPPKIIGRVTGAGSAGWLLTPKWNDSFRAVTRVLKAGGTVYRLQAPPPPWTPGTFWIPAGGTTNASSVQALAQEFGLPFEAVAAQPPGSTLQLKPLRVGLYRRFQGGNMDEGWTRWILDTWEFPYSRLEAAEVQKGALRDKYDIVIIPDDTVRMLVGSSSGTGRGEMFPPEFRRGLGDTGVKALQEFARGGGTLVFLNNASDLAIEQFGIPVTNVVKDLSTKEFFSPGSLLRVQFDPSHPLAYGMPSRGFVLNDDSPAFGVQSTLKNESITVVARYGDRDILQSGWLDGESKIARHGALMEVRYGTGRLVLVGFGAQRRAETHGTFKILFNAMYLAGSNEVPLRRETSAAVGR
jgi:hypothetical protein